VKAGEDEALIALADHSVGCTVCRPDVDHPEAPRPECPEAEQLYRAWRRACREERHSRA
jgi:hypothetical protein